MSNVEEEYLSILVQQFRHFKERAELGIKQLTEEELHWKPSEESNNIAILMKHISGNMNSRWNNFLTTDGESSDRNRDIEFVDNCEPLEKLMQRWEDGWKILFSTLENLKKEDLCKTVLLRNQSLSVLKALQIELAHISYHLGQILYIGKQIKDDDWIILSIPKNGSNQFNKDLNNKY
ncbi:DUF1572 family protein [Guptibacillus hwajinpoensis]|uniref:DUF1572 domain-containing protein n=1 Tax=Guptibacillus hwajinpoensis TaxID=208199 RepID=A0A0J6CNY4_9BACL|nr:DUF1572 family protein [Alkalihalobacillus macyae]KMM37946.1 hypothetical protein AB986_01010 [Alkalihalobacillus macyae]